MINTEKSFYGQQEGERILFVVRSHPLPVALKFAQVYLVSLGIIVIFLLISNTFPTIKGLFTLLGFFLGIGFGIIGSKVLANSQKKGISYITDRRIVRFEPTTFVATNIRTLSWDEVVKVKTFAPNMLWKQMAIGNVVIHARTTVRTAEEDAKGAVTADDIELKDIYYYRDLGNYIDKILFTYKQRPKEIANIKPFVLKPAGERY